MWWCGPDWFCLDSSEWPRMSDTSPTASPSEEEITACCNIAASIQQPVLPLDSYSSFNHVKRITAWLQWFIHNCCAHKNGLERKTPPLTAQKLGMAETYWILISQQFFFPDEIHALQKGHRISKSSPLLPLHPFRDAVGVLHVGGREQNLMLPYCNQHPTILNGKHTLTRLIISSEHLCLLHADPTPLLPP